MRVLLINPPWTKRGGNVWQSIACVMPPLGLAWIAAVLEEDGHEVRILDAHAERVSTEELEDRLKEMGDFGMVGITATTPTISSALAVARCVWRQWPRALRVLGGVHATVLPGEVLEEEAVDVVVRGEGERTACELAAGKPLAGIDGISYRLEGQVRHNCDRELIGDLDALPMPAYHLLPMEKYYPSAGATKRLPAISMLVTRGCPGRCTFCYRMFGQKVRVRSGAKVADEVKFLHDNYGINEICFYDDTFTAFPKEVHAFCRRLDELGVDITWSCFSRVDMIRAELLSDMKAHGCHQIMYGLESGSLEILDSVGKRANLDKARHAVALTKEAAIDVRAAFMLGNPGETMATMQQTLDFALSLDTELAIFNISTPYPGTEMFTWAKEKGYLLTEDWDEYDLSKSVMQLPTVSPEQIKQFYRKAYRKFFLRPKYLVRRLARLRGIHSLLDGIRGLRAVMRA